MFRPFIFRLGVWGLFFFVFFDFLLAQEIKIDAFQQKKFADKLYQKKEYYRAISEYQRFLYFFPKHSFVLDSRLQIGKSYLAGKDYMAASNYFEELKEQIPSLRLNVEINLYHAFSWMDRDSSRLFYYRQKNISKALEILKPLQIAEPIIFSFANEWEIGITNLDKKSPWLAGSLSAVVPGAGSLYTKRYNEALYAFFINSIFLGATLEANRSGQEAKASVLGFLALAFYTGNIYTAINGAHKYNDFLQRRYWNNLRTKHNFFFNP